MQFFKPRRLAQLAALGLLLTTASCKDFYDVNVYPLNPTSATSAQLLPGVQVGMATYLGFSIQGMGQATSTLVGQITSTRSIGAYQQQGDSFTNQWSGLYTDVLNNNEQIIRQETAAASPAYGYLGVAQIQKAYVFSMMVDLWGDIPYSEALGGTANRAPRFDRGQDIYNGNQALGIQSLFALIDAGIANLNRTGTNINVNVLANSDVIFGGNRSAWTHFGNSLKLKLYNQIRKTRSTADMQALVGPLLSSQAILQQAGEDLEVDYGTSTAPENRNIGFLSDFVSPTRENSISPYFYRIIMGGTPPNSDFRLADPRIRYYFYNQTNLRPEADYSSPATATGSYTFNNVTTSLTLGTFITTRLGSVGQSAAAANADIRTLPGVYAVGGRYMLAGNTVANAASGSGTAPQRLYPYYASKFTEAELYLMVQNEPATASQRLATAITASFNKVNEIATANPASFADNNPVLISAGQITQYVNSRVAAFDAATTTAAKLEILMTEKYKAGWGTGPDLYTDFRRTYYPRVPVPGSAIAIPERGLIADRTFGTALAPDQQISPAAYYATTTEDQETVETGPWPRRLYYRFADLIANTNANSPRNQPDITQGVFWDVQ